MGGRDLNCGASGNGGACQSQHPKRGLFLKTNQGAGMGREGRWIRSTLSGQTLVSLVGGLPLFYPTCGPHTAPDSRSWVPGIVQCSRDSGLKHRTEGPRLSKSRRRRGLKGGGRASDQSRDLMPTGRQRLAISGKFSAQNRNEQDTNVPKPGMSLLQSVALQPPRAHSAGKPPVRVRNRRGLHGHGLRWCPSPHKAQARGQE